MTNTIYSVALEATGYTNDTFNGTLEECINYIKENEYNNTEARIEKIIEDEKGCVIETLEIITEW